MADASTPNYALIKPELFASDDTWGGKLNDNFDTLDDAVHEADGRARRVAWRNMVINGAVEIDQRGSTGGISLSSAADLYGPDRWKARRPAGSSGVPTATLQQATGGPDAEFINCVSYTTTAFGSATTASSDQAHIEQVVEGFTFRRARFGTAGARWLRLSFTVLASQIGAYAVALQNGDRSRSIVKLFQIDDANTWEEKTLLIAPDTSGTWASDSGAGARLTFDLGAGSAVEGLEDAWAGADRRRTSACGRIALAPNQQFALTKVQLEAVDSAAEVATEFERRPYAEELALCQRYFEQSGLTNRVGTPGPSAMVGICQWSFAVTKRSAPNVTLAVSGSSADATVAETAYVFVQKASGYYPMIGAQSTADAELY